MIRIINCMTTKRSWDNTVYVYVARQEAIWNAIHLKPIDFSIFANEPMYDKSQDEMNRVCDAFEIKLRKEIKEGGIWRTPFTKLWNVWLDCQKKGKDLGLVCFCKPWRCHAESLRDALLDCDDLKASITANPVMQPVSKKTDEDVSIRVYKNNDLKVQIFEQDISTINESNVEATIELSTVCNDKNISTNVCVYYMEGGYHCTEWELDVSQDLQLRDREHIQMVNRKYIVGYRWNDKECTIILKSKEELLA